MAVIAHLTFWIAVLFTAAQAGWRRALVFVGLWLVGYAASAFLPLVGGYLFGSYVAVLDVALLVLLKTDRL